MQETLVAELAALEVFQGLTEEQLAWLASHGAVVELSPGETVFNEGDPSDHLFVVLGGSLELLVPIGGQLVPAWTQRPGAVTGLLPYSRMRHYVGRGRAIGVLRMLTIPRELFPEMLREIPELGQRMVSLMADRVREVTRAAQQREKMSALGTLAAGLAHELNNPAAAVRRDAEAVGARVAAIGRLAGEICAAGIDAAGVAALSARVDALLERPAPSYDPMARSRCEDAIGEWLDAHRLEDAWTLAGTLTEAGVRVEDLDAIAGSVPPRAAAVVVRWTEALLDARRLSRNLGSAAARISELVRSVKIYSHMDRGGDRQSVDIREGLDSALVMLGHKMKKKSIRLERHYADDLPAIEGFAGELNQVWANLVDNAIDAAPVGGLVRVDAEPSGTAVEVRVIDNGPGIPAPIQTRIFEPFFTTKSVGDGTGLGLDIVHRVVVEQHGGWVEVDSERGRTVFTVRLPAQPGA